MDQGQLGKIGNKVDETRTTSKVSADTAAPEKAPTAAASRDTVNLTNSAKLLERLDKSLASLPAVDAGRVAEIKSAIENGNYEIDAGAIAEAMMRLDRSLGD